GEAQAREFVPHWQGIARPREPRGWRPCQAGRAEVRNRLRAFSGFPRRASARRSPPPLPRMRRHGPPLALAPGWGEGQVVLELAGRLRARQYRLYKPYESYGP